MTRTRSSRYMNGVYPCPSCGIKFAVDELDDHTGLCPYCRGEKAPRRPTAPHHCRWCGKPIRGRSDKLYCTTAHRVAAHRARQETSR